MTPRSAFVPPRRGLGVDLDALPVRDRAAIRLIARADAATARQLARLIYGRERTAQERLLRLARAGVLERAVDPRSGRGTATYAYRLSVAARARLGITDKRASSLYLRHTLDTTDAVCAIARPRDPAAQHPVQAWLTERMAGDLPGPAIRPDSIIAVQTASASGVLCLEMDEGTQHAPRIRARLAAYRSALQRRPGWHLLFVVQTRQRVDWLRRLAAASPSPSAPWLELVVTLPDLAAFGGSAPVTSLTSMDPRTLDSALTDQRRRLSSAPVGTADWIQLLGSGGAEDLQAPLR